MVFLWKIRWIMRVEFVGRILEITDAGSLRGLEGTVDKKRCREAQVHWCVESIGE